MWDSRRWIANPLPGQDRPESEEMTDKRARPALNLAIAAVMATVLGGCAGGSQQAALQEPGVGPETPATVRADQIVGRWGVASYRIPKTGHGLKPRLKHSANCPM